LAKCQQSKALAGTSGRGTIGSQGFSEHNDDDMAWNHDFNDELSGEQMIGDDYMDGDSDNDNDLPSSFSKYFRPGACMYV
jgi:hypothetical protein